MLSTLTSSVEGALAWKSVGRHSVEAQEDAQPQQAQAPGAVLDTQDRKDCVAVILFDHVSPQDSGRLTRASDIAAGSTSVCQKVIIFLTNLGSGADTSVTKRQSCENRGILCNVPDGSDLSFIMACFYKYSTGQEMCQPSFTRYRVCLPAHDTVAADPRLMGITGINLNVISRAPSGAARTNVPCVARSGIAEDVRCGGVRCDAVRGCPAPDGFPVMIQTSDLLGGPSGSA